MRFYATFGDRCFRIILHNTIELNKLVSSSSSKERLPKKILLLTDLDRRCLFPFIEIPGLVSLDCCCCCYSRIYSTPFPSGTRRVTGIKSEKKRVEVDEWLSLIYGSQKEIHRKLYKFFSLVRSWCSSSSPVLLYLTAGPDKRNLHHSV